MKSQPNIGQWAAAFCLFIILLITSPKVVLATHSAGAEITYLHLTGNNYRLHATFYRDCFGIPAPTSIILQAAATSCGINTTFTLLPLPGTGQPMTPVCPGTFTICDGGNTPGVEKWEYELDVPLPAQCADWVFSYSVCCRWGGTVQPGSNLYVESKLNNLTSDNNSPQFTNDPLQFSCMDQFYHYNNGMFDPDGDSLAYRLIDAIGATYIPPYTGQQPFTSVPPVTFDSVTGDYIMHPTMNENGPLVFEILDYRNGVLMGSVIREMNTIIQPCVSHNPTATEMNGTAQQVAYVLPDDTICFDIFSDDQDAGEVVTMTWNNTIPAATFTTAGTPHPTGTFCWNPSLSDLRPQPYMFTSTVTDNNCPMNNAGIYSYYIYVTLDSSLVFLNVSSGEVNSPLSIYPNPAKGVFIIQSEEIFSLLKIYNSLGECILKKGFEKRIDLTEQPRGIYFVEAITNEGNVTRQKLVKE